MVSLGVSKPMCIKIEGVAATVRDTTKSNQRVAHRFEYIFIFLSKKKS